MTDHYGETREELLRELEVQKSIRGEFEREEEANAYKRSHNGVVSWDTDPDIGTPAERAALDEAWTRASGVDAYGNPYVPQVRHTTDGVVLD